MVGILIAALVLIAALFGISSIMQSYASAQQAKAVIETAKTAQMVSFANVVVIVVLALILAGVVYLLFRVIKARASSRRIDRRVNRLEAGRRYGAELREYLAEIEADRVRLKENPSEESESGLRIADDAEVDDFLETFLKDW